MFCLSVVEPVIEVSPVSLVAYLHTNGSFFCNASGLPSPTASWARENGQLPELHSVRNGVLTLINMTVIDQGRYTCTATNAVGFTRKTVSLIIEGVFLFTGCLGEDVSNV